MTKTTIGFVMVGVLAHFCSSEDKPGRASAALAATAPQAALVAPTAPAAVEEKPLAVSAAALARDYEANEVNADNKYKGRKLAITGNVENVSKGFAGGMHIRIVTPGGVTVTAALDNPEWVAKLKTGELIGLNCTTPGMMLGTVVLDCS